MEAGYMHFDPLGIPGILKTRNKGPKNWQPLSYIFFWNQIFSLKKEIQKKWSPWYYYYKKKVIKLIKKNQI